MVEKESDGTWRNTHTPVHPPGPSNREILNKASRQGQQHPLADSHSVINAWEIVTPLSHDPPLSRSPTTSLTTLALVASREGFPRLFVKLQGRCLAVTRGLSIGRVLRHCNHFRVFMLSRLNDANRSNYDNYANLIDDCDRKHRTWRRNIRRRARTILPSRVSFVFIVDTRHCVTIFDRKRVFHAAREIDNER